MIQERLAAAQGYIQRNENVAATMQCEEVLHVDSANTQAQLVLSQIRGHMQPSGPLPQGAGGVYSSPTSNETDSPASGNLSSGPLANIGNVAAGTVSLSNTSGGNTGIMGNMGSASNFGGAGNSGPVPASTGISGGGMGSAPRNRITASHGTGLLSQAHTL